MVPLTALWLPILLSTVIVFMASAIMHMVLTYHKSDFRKLPNEDRIIDAIRDAGVTPGSDYSFPYYRFEEMKSPATVEKLNRGPVGFMTVLPTGPHAIGKSLTQWFVYCIVISIFAAYLTGRTLGPETGYLEVFRVIGTAAFLGYGPAHAQDSIWAGRSWIVTFKHLFDSLIYAILTAAVFGYLWPRSL